MGEGPIVNEEEKARESRLQLAIVRDNVDGLHELIKEERGLLDRVSKHPFPHTPLHVAAAVGTTQVAMEMAILRPSFARELNVEGYSPMHLALQHANYKTMRALMTINTELIRVRGRGGITPLHYLAEKERKDELKLLAEFLHACESSIKDLTSRHETAVHVAVKKNNLKAFKVLLEWLEQVNLTKILYSEDEDDKTFLQIAELEAQREIVKLLKRYGKLELTKLERFTSWFIFRDELANSITIAVATVVATATYQAMLTPPGGYWQDNSSNRLVNSTVFAAHSSGIAVKQPHMAGELILNGLNLYVFSSLNTMVFLASIIIISVTAIPLLPRTLPVYILMTFVGTAYFVTLSLGFPESDALAGRFMLIIYFGWLFIMLVVPIALRTLFSRIRGRIKAPRTRVATPKE